MKNFWEKNEENFWKTFFENPWDAKEKWEKLSLYDLGSLKKAYPHFKERHVEILVFWKSLFRGAKI